MTVDIHFKLRISSSLRLLTIYHYIPAVRCQLWRSLIRRGGCCISLAIFFPDIKIPQSFHTFVPALREDSFLILCFLYSDSARRFRSSSFWILSFSIRCSSSIYSLSDTERALSFSPTYQWTEIPFILPSLQQLHSFGGYYIIDCINIELF